MSKFGKLKMYNILVFALIPILIAAMAATITLAAMTATKEGKNTIQISGIGDLTCTVSATGLYPDSTQNISMTFNYAGDKNDKANSLNSVIIDFNTFKFTEVTATSDSGKAYAVNLDSTNAHNKPAYFTSYKLLNGATDVTSSTVTVTKETPVTITLQAVMKAGDSGYTGTAPTDDSLGPKNYLTNSVKSVAMKFTVAVKSA